MSYSAGGEYISRAYTVEELINILSNDVPEGLYVAKSTDTKIAGGPVVSSRSPIVEVWYDESNRTVILK